MRELQTSAAMKILRHYFRQSSSSAGLWPVPCVTVVHGDSPRLRSAALKITSLIRLLGWPFTFALQLTTTHC